jgi:asparagine synthase (glutamine-hydrolysing)
MRAHGVRRLLSGEGGDGLMWEGGTGDPSASVTDSISSGRLGDAMRSALTFAKQRRTSVWRILWDDVIRSQRWKRPSPLTGVTPMPWLPRKKIDAYAEAGARARAEHADLSSAPVTAALAFVHVDQARCSIALHPSRLTGAVDLSYPYLDRRLVQFMLAVPFSQKSRPGISRSLQRRALEGVLPEAVRTRKHKANGAGQLMRMFQAEASRIDHVLSTDLRLADLGLIDRASFLAAAERVRGGDGTFLTGVLKTIAAEQWLRLLDITRPTPGAL